MGALVVAGCTPYHGGVVAEERDHSYLSCDEPGAGDDADGDGWPTPRDCDDDDPSRHPYAVEVAGDDIDQDCDGLDDTVVEVSELPDFWEGCHPGELYVVEDGRWVHGSAVCDMHTIACAQELGGTLRLQEMTNLRNLRGLENLSRVGGLHFHTLGRIEDVSALVSLHEIDGDFDLHDIGAGSLRGLQVRTVRGHLRVGPAEDSSELYGTRLASLGGLEALETVEGNVEIVENMQLWDLDGLSGLQTIGGDLLIGDRTFLEDEGTGNRLVSLEGLDHVSVAGTLMVASNWWLTTLEGLSVASVGGNVEIRGNHDLEDLGTLGALGVVPGDLYVHDLPALVDLNGLTGLTEVGGDLVLAELLVEGLDGLDGLARVGGDLVIEDTPCLAASAIEELVARVEVVGEVVVDVGEEACGG